jgi:murein DD-endopeptidase MepM/ murein hydrolase activator NlpD
VIRAAVVLAAALTLGACSRDNGVVGSDTTRAPAPTIEVTTTSSSTTTSTTTPARTSTTPVPTTVAGAAGQYAFPVVGRSSYSRSHAGYPATDIFAACGLTVVAVTAGRVDEVSRVDQWDPAHDDPALRSGKFVALVGDDGVRYHTSHFSEVAAGIEAGGRVRAGQPIGVIGTTGNARGKPCHTHFGISPPTQPGDWQTRRGVVWPWPYLDSWKAGGQKSPADEVRQL